ncbi:MAG: DUF4345 family protein [Pseudomonadota bacterium]
MRRAFQTTLLLVAFIPFVLGIMTLAQGAVRFAPEASVTAALDSQMRFSALRSMLPFFLTIWIVRNLESSGSVLTIILAATAAGGLARILSATEYGLPHPAMAGVIAFEIGGLLLIPWYRAVTRQTQMQAVV